MPIKNLPANPDLDHLKLQAKTLLKAVRAGDPGAVQRVREFHPHFREHPSIAVNTAEFSLSDAQLAIAREYAFASWPKLKAYLDKGGAPDDRPLVERIEDPSFRRAVEFLDSGDESGLRNLLKSYPEVVRQKVFYSANGYFGKPTLLEFTAENPHRNGKLPPNIVAIAEVILAAGADKHSASKTLELVASGNVARQQSLQIRLIELLGKYGADLNAAMPAALVHGEFEAVETLLRLGARLDLPVAAAIGRTELAESLLPSSSKEDMHPGAGVCVSVWASCHRRHVAGCRRTGGSV